MADAITKQSAADAFNSDVKNKVTWTYSYSNPPAPWSGYTNGVTKSKFGSPPSNMSDNDINGTDIIASTFVDDVRNWIANNLSQIRYIRIIHRNTGDNTNINGDNTYTAVCSTNYKQTVSLTQSEMGIATGQIIAAGGINWTAAYNAWTKVRNNTAFTITNTIHVQHVQHSSHSDHGSRVRR